LINDMNDPGHSDLLQKHRFKKPRFQFISIYQPGSPQSCSKRSQRQRAREIDERRRTQFVRCSEAIERNEAYEAFSVACLVIYALPCPLTPNISSTYHYIPGFQR